MRKRTLTCSGHLVLLGIVAACSSPTGFDPSRDVVITVDDVVLGSSEAESEVSIPLDLTILNRGTRRLGYMGVCGLALIHPEGSDAFSISRLCTLVVEPVEIEPGQEVSLSLLAIGAAEEWGDFGAGEYTLDLGLFVESISRAQLVRSTPFRIEVVPEEGE